MEIDGQINSVVAPYHSVQIPKKHVRPISRVAVGLLILHIQDTALFSEG
jgi:hypothetical protein